jgi:hypothetical protein
VRPFGVAELGVRPMKNTFITILFVICSLATSFSTQVESKSLKELVSMSYNVWGGTVTNVRMTNEKGKDITDPEATTGPGLENTIYLDVTIDQNLIFKSTYSIIPKTISIPLWQKWHYSLSQIKEIEGSKSIFLLDRDLKPAYPAGFQRSLEEEKKIESFIRK